MGEIYTIAPHRPFVDELARGLLEEAGHSPHALIDCLVLLPTRRACRSLGEAFLRQSGGRALMLPRIQPLGEVEPEELFPGGALELELPPAIGRVRRQLLLARLLGGYDPAMPVEHRLRLADELARLLDELGSERCSLEALQHLVPDHLAEHWQASRTLLDLIDRHWPAILAGDGALDPAERRNRLLDGLARHLETERPDRRIVAAGSTGSIGATRGLLRAVLALPRGAVVLSGLERDADDALWRAIGPSHPQAGLKQLLEALDRPRATVRPWTGDAPAARAAAARTALLRTAMLPADAGPPEPPAEDLIEAGRSGFEVMVVPDLGTEAAALALRMRAVLEEAERTAMLVTPDRHLARRVAVELRRWGIEVDDSAGVPLDQTAQGTLLLLSAGLVNGVGPASLLALLKHPLVRMSRPSGAIRSAAERLERAVLRGPRISGGFPGILTELRRDQAEVARRRPDRADLHARSIALVERLVGMAAPLLELAGTGTADLADLVGAHLAVVEGLTAPPPGTPDGFWEHESGEAAASLLREILDGARDGHPVAAKAYPALLAHFMAAWPVRPRAPRHPRLAILGQLEARLQHADLVLIGGLNEGVWPAPVDPGPWLNRAMRAAIGLQPVERRIGLAAHDLQQLAAAPEVLLSRAGRDAHGNPAVPSRWLVRLQTLLEGADDDRAPPPARSGWWPEWAGALDRPAGPPAPVDQPRPAPPRAARPRELSVSDVGLWMRDPYALYARRILKLRPLAPLEQEPGALERGIMIHDVLERFVRRYPERLPEDALARLLDLGREAFQAYTHRPVVRRLWWPRFERAAEWYLDQERQRRPTTAALMVEVEGALPLDLPGGRFLLRARADRIERTHAGELIVIDYKTGQPPKKSEVTSGRQPQLPLEAWMVGEGAFQSLEPAPIEGLWFWSIRGDAAGGRTEALKGDPAEHARSAAEGLTSLIAHYDDERSTYPARLRPDVSFPQDYDHLARFREWAG